MAYQITPYSLHDKEIDQLTPEEMSFIHLSTSYSAIGVKSAYLRSTLSFIYQNIQSALSNNYSKDLMPYLSLCAILDQLGISYNRKDKDEPRFTNGIKRCLVLFGELDEDDELINILYAFRNGLLHNISLTSHDKHAGKFYLFGFDKNISGVHENAEIDWDGDYVKLDRKREKYTTAINIAKFKDLVYRCIQKADDLNQDSQLEIRLVGGVRQLFADYIRGVDKQTETVAATTTL